MQVTKVEDFKATVKAFEDAFSKRRIKRNLERCYCSCCSASVEEKDAGCTEYDRSKATDLMASIKDYPNLVFEGHSTDYQTKIQIA